MKKKRQSLREQRESLYAAWSTMPDDFLKEKYQSLKRRQRLWASPPLWFLIPALTVYGIIGWSDFFASEYVQFQQSYMNSAGVVYTILFAFCSAFLSDKETKGLIKAPICFGIGSVLIYLLIEAGPLLVPLMELYLVLAAVMERPIVEDLNFLRSLPNFPFNPRRQDVNLSGMSQKQVLRHLEAALEGKTLEGGGEEVFTAEDPEAVVTPPENTEEYFQQHRVIYKN